MFRALGNALLSLLSPQECNVCSQIVDDQGLGVACHDCWLATRIFDEASARCCKCGAYSGPQSIRSELSCHKCDEHHYDKAAAIGVYEKALAATVVHLKSTPFIPKAALTALQTAFNQAGFSATLIMPVPLSKRRLIERGFNQAEIIGKAVSRISGLPIDSRTLIRKIHSPIHRVGMDMKARELTVSDSFAVTRPKLVTGQSILLIDDVFTSGSTTSNCAKVLKKNRAARVEVLTLARAVFD